MSRLDLKNVWFSKLFKFVSSIFNYKVLKYLNRNRFSFKIFLLEIKFKKMRYFVLIFVMALFGERFSEITDFEPDIDKRLPASQKPIELTFPYGMVM